MKDDIAEILERLGYKMGEQNDAMECTAKMLKGIIKELEVMVIGEWGGEHPL